MNSRLAWAALGSALAAAPTHAQSLGPVIAAVDTVTAAGTARLLDASPERKAEALSSVDDQLALLNALKAKIEAERKLKTISAAVAAERTQEVQESRMVLAGAKNLLTDQGPGPANLEPEQLRRQTEAIRWITRPVLALCKGGPWAAKIPDEWSPRLEAQQPMLRQISGAVGLVTAYDVLPGGALQRRQEAGTAVVVGPRQIVTNKHVVKDALLGYRDLLSGKWTLYSKVAGQIEFPKEYSRCPGDPAAIRKARIIGVEYADPDENTDYIILTTDVDLPPPVVFAETPDVVDSDQVAVIGYPGRPSVDFLQPAQIDKIFGTPDGRTPFPIARVSLGYTLPNQDSGHWFYDATTWGGSSGSVVVSLVNGQVIGLHFDGLNAPQLGLGYNRALSAAKIAAWQKSKVAAGGNP